MGNVYFISDLHLGHKRILEFAGDYRDGDTPAEHDAILINKWNSAINKRDKVFVLGDVIFTKDIDMLGELSGRKVLIRGNHDIRANASDYLKYFEEIYGLFTYKDYWLSHCPLHPAELRGKKNIHGHVHMNSIRDYHHDIDKRYINVCVEACDGFPVRFDDIHSGVYGNVRKF